MNQRGFVLIEFVIALPLLIFLLYALGTLTFSTMKIAREQIADYVLETEAQEIIDRITADARNAYSVEIRKYRDFETVIFMCDNVTNEQRGATFDDEYIIYNKEILEPRIYAVDKAGSGIFHIYFKRKDDNYYNNPIIGENSFGNTFVTDFSFFVPAPKVLHVTFETESLITHQKVKFSTAVYMSNCKKISDKGTIYEYE